jgi:hypothetical protein
LDGILSVGHKRSLSEEEVVRRPPSEKARFHSRPQLSVLSIGKEMSLRDPHYKPTIQNPFATLPRSGGNVVIIVFLRFLPFFGRKIVSFLNSIVAIIIFVNFSATKIGGFLKKQTNYKNNYIWRV